MQFFKSELSYFVKSVHSILRISRETGHLDVIKHEAFAEEHDLICLAEVDAVIGKLVVDEAVFILVVIGSTKVATAPNRQVDNAEIRRIDRVVAVPVVDVGTPVDKSVFEGSSSGGNAVANKLKTQQRKLLKLVGGGASGGRKAPQIESPRVLEEVLRLFNDNGDFYFTTETADLTRNVQSAANTDTFQPDPRYFWNRELLSDILHLGEAASEWIRPVIQGFVAERALTIDGADIASTELSITLISRRSTQRAGTRYLRRGVDEEGNVANFVETELIITVFGHMLAFVQIRGSVPLFWSQKGFRYRPPLTIDKDVGESLPVFEKHVNRLVETYGEPVIAVNLVNQTGRELCLAQAFLEHVLALDNAAFAYFSFDFHYHCRALKFGKVNDLIASLKESLTKVGYCWIDKSGELVLRQKGIIRTNCVDCLDRTNVVQGAISQAIALQQFRRLGLISPMIEEPTAGPEALTVCMQQMWADNGDAISRQYAGTDALKGDVTRSGQRKLTGLVKDGYNSASRYYLSHMRDSYRQAAIDALLAGKSTFAPTTEDTEDEDEDECENIGRLVGETVRFVLPEGEILVGGWALVDGDNRNDLVDSILLLTRSHVYIAQYEEQSDKLTDVTIIGFDQIFKLEVGVLGKSPRKHLRIYWRVNGGIYFDSWRAAKTRLFNNVAIPLKNVEEADEYVQAIGEQLRITVNMCTGAEIPIAYVNKLNGAASSQTKPIISSLLTGAAFKLRQINNRQNKPTPSAAPPAIQIDEEISSNSPSTPDTDKEEQPTSSISHSQSEGLISEQQIATISSAPISNSNSIVAKLSAKLKSGPWKSSAPDVSDSADLGPLPSTSAVALDPFQQYKERIIASKSLIQML
uniref:SAC domain-containing protein n=1 Tax=Panagrellus redivivus TaxID=6233 RepID=A0A7E4V144_PANRE